MEPENKTPVSAKSTKSNKWLYVVGGIVVVLVLAKFATGALLMHALPGGVNMQRGMDGSATYSNSQGSVTVGANKMPDNWPSDAPTYTNAQIQSAVSSNPQTGQAGSAVVFTTSDSAQTVTDFYTKTLAADGWKVEQTVSSGASSAITATKDTRNFGVYIVDSGDGKVTVTASVSTPQ